MSEREKLFYAGVRIVIFLAGILVGVQAGRWWERAKFHRLNPFIILDNEGNRNEIHISNGTNELLRATVMTMDGRPILNDFRIPAQGDLKLSDVRLDAIPEQTNTCIGKMSCKP